MKSGLSDLLKKRILLLDGAMGTVLQTQRLTATDFGGPDYEGCNEYLCVTRPELIQSIHEQYLQAGADIIETNTFGSNPIVLSEYGLAKHAQSISRAAARLAKAAATRYSTGDSPRFVAGSMGPTTKSLSITGGVTFTELEQAYYVQALGLLEGGVDLLLLETSQDMLNVKAASLGIQRAFSAVGLEVPLMISGTVEPMGTTLAGQTIDAFYLAVEHLKPFAVGLNCATGPEFMRDHVRVLSELASCAVSCYPNAGLPDEDGNYPETPASFAAKLQDFVNHGWLNVVGGCCGTTPPHIRALREMLDGAKPREIGTQRRQGVSGTEALFLEEDNRPILVGERTNLIGSRKFRQLIAAKQYDLAAEMARAQVKAGAQVLDICLADPDGDEREDMKRFVQQVVRQVRVPLMIDSTDAVVAEAALQYLQGKSILNSTNLEDGEDRFFRFVHLAQKYGTALVIGTIDEQGMAVGHVRKMEIVHRCVKLLKSVGFPVENAIFDTLTFPVGTGDANYLGAARETIEGIRLIKEAYPGCATILGISNVSFGLPTSGREVLNAVFLYHCTKAGLDYAIVNSEKLKRFASLSEEERKLTEQLLFDTNDETLQAFTTYFRQHIPEYQGVKAPLPLPERLAQHVVEGTKEGLIPDLSELLKELSPLDIINGPLMEGMNKVGELFNRNELIVAEVLQSAEVMKAAVSYLEPKMEKTDSSNKGTVLLATVKGDVHDIGKNLVEMIFSNNGFRVQNLGIKVAPEQLIQAVHEYQPDIIGLSGLLVKSSQQMMVTAEELAHADIDLPILVGGAALTKKFTATRIAPVYCGTVLYAKDAMDGLRLANVLSKPGGREELRDETQMEADSLPLSPQAGLSTEIERTLRSPEIRLDAPTFSPPDFERHVLRNYPLYHLRPYLNMQMLLGKHLGLRGNVEKLLQRGDAKAEALVDVLDSLLKRGSEENLLEARGLYQFFPAQSEGNRLLIYNAQNLHEVVEEFTFRRQSSAPYLCLADFVKPVSSGEMDAVAMLAVTTGTGVAEAARQLKDAGRYLESHALQALALELAEAFAERLHQVLRDIWGFPDSTEMSMHDRFIAKYQGLRVSFGYPACPDLEDQGKLFRLLQPETIGLHLTDGFMMEPEASVSALVFAHPDARYFNVISAADL